MAKLTNVGLVSGFICHFVRGYDPSNGYSRLYFLQCRRHADRQQSWTKCKDFEASQKSCFRAFGRSGPTHPVHECAQRDKTPFLQKIAISFSRVNAATRLFQLGGCFGDRDAIATDANFAICFATEVASPACTKGFRQGAAVYHSDGHLSNLASTETR